MSAALSAVWRLGRLRRAPAREAASPAQPSQVLISAHGQPHASKATIEQFSHLGGRLELVLRLEDGSTGTASLFDDDVNSLELCAGRTVFVLPPQNGAGGG
ncbi:MAG TPA: hypothetical protein VGI67_18190 [Thermoleophilaceae bacterium]|jgi:hypothetical protein